MSSVKPDFVKQLDYGNNHILTIDTYDGSVTFDLQEITNDGDGAQDGFELSWEEVYRACKKFVESK